MHKVAGAGARRRLMRLGQGSRLHTMHTVFHCFGFVMKVSSVFRWLSASRAVCKVGRISSACNAHRVAKQAALAPCIL